MTGFNRVFVDTAPFIYFLEDDPNFGKVAKSVFTEVLSQGKSLNTSAVTCEDYLVHPYQADDADAVRVFFDFIEECHVQVDQLPLKSPRKRRSCEQSTEMSRAWTLYSLPPRLLAAAIYF